MSSDHILLQTYPANLSDSDLCRLLDLTGERLAAKAPKYCAWVRALVQAEINRRDAEHTDAPVEVDLPRFNASRWTGSDLADAIVASSIVMQIEDSPAALELLEKLDFVLRNWVAHRLRRLG